MPSGQVSGHAVLDQHTAHFIILLGNVGQRDANVLVGTKVDRDRAWPAISHGEERSPLVLERRRAASAGVGTAAKGRHGRGSPNGARTRHCTRVADARRRGKWLALVHVEEAAASAVAAAAARGMSDTHSAANTLAQKLEVRAKWNTCATHTIFASHQVHTGSM